MSHSNGVVSVDGFVYACRMSHHLSYVTSSYVICHILMAWFQWTVSYMPVYTHAQTRARTRARSHTYSIHTYAYIHMHTYICIHTYAYIHAYIHKSTYIYNIDCFWQDTSHELMTHPTNSPKPSKPILN